MEKICKKCGRELPISEFSKCKSRKDGLQPYCKACKKQWYAANAEHLKLYDKQRYSTIEGYARHIRLNNLQADRKYGRIAANEDPLPSVEEYIELLQQRDYYDGKQYPFNEMGLDRIDSSKPHTLDNVVPCTTEHNRQRGRKSFEEFCELMQNSF